MVDGDNNNSQTSIDHEIESWSNMEYALRQEYSVVFSKMLSEAKQYYKAFENMSGASAASTETLLMSIILQNQKMIDKLIKDLARLQEEYEIRKKRDRTMDRYF